MERYRRRFSQMRQEPSRRAVQDWQSLLRMAGKLYWLEDMPGLDQMLEIRRSLEGHHYTERLDFGQFLVALREGRQSLRKFRNHQAIIERLLDWLYEPGNGGAAGVGAKLPKRPTGRFGQNEQTWS